MNKSDTKKVINSPHFGQLELDPGLLYFFKDGIYGFEDLHDFIIVSEERSEPFKWLVSVEEPTLSFPIIDPLLIKKNYNIGKRFMDNGNAFFVIVTLKNEVGNMSANMKAPLILDLSSLEGQQIILTSDKYPTNFELPIKK